MFHDGSWLSLIQGCAIVLICGFAITLIDAAGWRALLQRVAGGTPFLHLWISNTAAEGFGRILPGGLVVADTIKTGLASRKLNITPANVMATVTARRWFLGFVQALFLLAAALVALASLPGFPYSWILLATSVGLLFFLSLVLIASHAGRTIHSGRWSRWTGLGSTLEQYCRSLNQVVRDRGNLGTVVISYACLWLLETGETFLLLWLSGIPVSFATAALVEAVASAVRLAAFFAPAGIGAQEAAYGTVLLSLGATPTLGGSASFLIWKRSRDVLWATVSVVLLAREGAKIPWRRAVPQAEGAA